MYVLQDSIIVDSLLKAAKEVRKNDSQIMECNPKLPTDKRQCGREAVCVRSHESPIHHCMCTQTMKPPGPDRKCPLNIVTQTPLGMQISVIVPRGDILATPSPYGSKQNSTNKVTTPSTPTVNFIPFAVAAGLLVSVIGLLLLGWKIFYRGTIFRRRNAEKKKTVSPLSKTIILEERYTTNPQYTSAGGSAESPTVPIISRSVITELQEIGEGFFGKVYKGQLHTVLDDTETVETVAVKMLKQTTNEEAEEDFIREVEIMSAFRHENILSLTGFCPRDGTNCPWMVFEYMPFGDLATVLRNSNHHFWLSVPGLPRLSPDSLLTISLQIAEGMEYLASQRFVHRDLACRNCLVGSGLVVKIADFGMSRDVYTCDYYKTGGTRMLPVRWMSPESILFGKFTLESDIWSYGVVLWEIYSYGKQPYFGHTNEEVLKFILDGKLLDEPEHCPEEVRNIMSCCWKKDPKERINFTETRNRFLKLQEENDRQADVPLPRPPPIPITINHRVFCDDDEQDGDEDDDSEAQNKSDNSLSMVDVKIEDIYVDAFDDDDSNVAGKEISELLDEDGYLQPFPGCTTHPEYIQPLP